MFTSGFEKVALSEKAKLRAALALAAGAIAGAGAYSGHQAHVGNKIVHARHGKDYKPESFIEKHPKTTGAFTLGLAPAFSMAMSSHKLQREADRKNPKIKKVLKEHPIMAPTLGVE